MIKYQSIYRKWRPQLFEDIVGQKHITQTLKNAIKLNRISHAYLFSGPRGVGKTTTARILAKALNCQKGPTEYPCNQCAQCVRINQGQSMDVLEIDGASNRGIDEIRELRSKIGFAPAEGKYKIYIIDEVHMLTNEAFNALLKTLEEPPSQVLFIFATTAPQKVPKTILSRCQCFYFRRLSLEEMVEKLTKIATEEKLNIDLPSLRLIAESATGSMRDAESILDQVITYSEKQVTPEVVREILGLIPQEIFWRLLKAIIARDTKTGLEIINKLVKEGVDFHKFVQDLIVYVHQVSLLKILDKDNSDAIFSRSGEESEKLSELSNSTNIKTILDIIEELKLVEEKIRYYYYPWILLELMVVKLTQSEEQSYQKESESKIVNEFISDIQKKNHIEQSTGKIKEEHLSKNSKNKVLSSNEEPKKVPFEQLWSKVLARVKQERISLYTFLMASNTVHIEDDQLIVGFLPNYLFHKESLEKRVNREIVEAILKEEANCEIKLKCFIEEDNTKKDEDFKLGKKKDKIEDSKVIMRVAAEQENQISNKVESNLSSKNILEKALDLFGGTIFEEKKE